MNLLQTLAAKHLIRPPRWLPDNLHYLAMMGSVAYGVSGETSDVDVVGFAIPPKDVIFPHLRGEIPGFGTPAPRFEQWQEHHIVDPDALSGQGREYDLTAYSIVKFFQLCLENNPNMVDVLFAPARCLLHVTAVGHRVRDHRHLFLHKGAWQKFRGYAYSQLHKMSVKERHGKRAQTIAEYGFDVKFAYHVVRLLLEAEQILTLGDLDLERDRNLLKAIRRGEWTEERIRDWFAERDRAMEEVYRTSELPAKPDEAAIKNLLLECLEMHFGSLGDAYVAPDRYEQALRQIREIVDRTAIG